MRLNDLRKTLRNWFKERKLEDPAIVGIPLVVPNQGGNFGEDATWMRLTIQTGDAEVIGVGAPEKRRRRYGRVFVEVFGKENDGDGHVSRIVDVIEQIWRDAMPASSAPHPDILIKEPSSFERDEPGRYCQVVSVPFEADHIS